MSIKKHSDTHSTKHVKVLLKKLYDSSVVKDSLLDQALAYYEAQPINQHKLDELKFEVNELTANETTKDQQRIDQLEAEFREFKQDLRYESNQRHKSLYTICQDILTCTEGATFKETNRKTAQLLGIIQLISPTEGMRVAEVNEKHKPLYRAVLCMRLLDQLCIEEASIVSSGYIHAFKENISGEEYKEFPSQDPAAYKTFVENVKIPLLMASLVQDIGNYHPDAQAILNGKEGASNRHRTLKVEERKKLLQINYRETLKFLVDGIGAPIYVGNSKADRDKFNINEHKKLVFMKQLLKESVAPKEGIGNLLKVPQIYASIILSTKSSYNFKLLPKVYQALDQNAERGTCSPSVVDSLRKITGDFPQGFGVTYIPESENGEQVDRYEYAIVNQLYPDKPDVPLCRTATRHLTFLSFGQDIALPPERNLYYVETAQQFSTISKARLNEILEKLASNYQERKKLDLLPRCWQANDYFSISENQKLWNKAAV